MENTFDAADDDSTAVVTTQVSSDDGDDATAVSEDLKDYDPTELAAALNAESASVSEVSIVQATPPPSP